MQDNFEKENAEYERQLKKQTKNDAKETLVESDHRLFVEGYECEELMGIYDDLSDLELADLSDFFTLERRDVF